MRQASVAQVPVFKSGNARTRVAQAIRSQLIEWGHSEKDERYQLCIQDMHYPLLDLIDSDADIEPDQAKSFASMFILHGNANPMTFLSLVQFATYVNTCHKKW